MLYLLLDHQSDQKAQGELCDLKHGLSVPQELVGVHFVIDCFTQNTAEMQTI